MTRKAVFVEFANHDPQFFGLPWLDCHHFAVPLDPGHTLKISSTAPLQIRMCVA